VTAQAHPPPSDTNPPVFSFTATSMVRAVADVPSGPVTTSATSYSPTSTHVWTGLGSEDVSPSPKSQK